MLVGGCTDCSAAGGRYNGVTCGFLKDLLDLSMMYFVPCQVSFLKGNGICLAGVYGTSSSFPR